MKSYARLALLSIAFILVFTGFAGSYALGATESEALDAVVAAEETIATCYRAAAEADGAGADVAELLRRLDEAGELLSKAELSYGRQDFDSAFDYSSQSVNKLTGLVAEAEILHETAVKEYYASFLVTTGGSAAGVAAVVCSGFVVWRLLKKRYGEGASK